MIYPCGHETIIKHALIIQDVDMTNTQQQQQQPSSELGAGLSGSDPSLPSAAIDLSSTGVDNSTSVIRTSASQQDLPQVNFIDRITHSHKN